MFAVRAAWSRCAVRQALAVRTGLSGTAVPRRLMSSVPGGSGENLIYAILCGGAFAGALTYAYKTVASDSSRFTERITELQTRPKDDWKPKPWPPKSQQGGDDAEEAEESSPVELAAEVNGDEVEAVETVVETVAGAVAEAAEVVADVSAVVEEAAEEVATVAEEVEKIAEKVEAAAEALEAPVIPAEEPAAATEEPAAESNGTPASGTAETQRPDQP